MTFVFPILLGGLVLAGIPVLLHLLLRQKPKRVLFPAFQFLVKRHKTNLTKLRLRHILLMALRVLVLAAIVLALAQPKIMDNPWSLSTDQAVAAVFVFDTSASMDYTVAGMSRLADAQKRAVEMLKLLPENSEVAILDSGEATPIYKGEWLSREKAAERIGHLKLQPASGPVSARVGAALKLLSQIAISKDENQRDRRGRVLCVFSDRTTASWDAANGKSLQELANQVPPSFERLAAVRTGIAPQEKLLAELKQRLPDVGQKFPEQALAGPLGNLGERLVQLRADEYPDAATQPLLAAVRAKQQELLALLEKAGDAGLEDAKDYASNLMSALRTSLRNSAGFIPFYIDVGVEQPADLALADLQLLREGVEKFTLQAESRAAGDDFRPTLGWQVGAQQHDVALEVKAGKREFSRFQLKDKSYLKTEHHQAKVTARPSDQLAINNSRYLTWCFRPVLVLADQDKHQEALTWARAIEANRFGAAGFRCDVMTPAEFWSKASGAIDSYAAVFLCSLKAPDEKLWKALAEYAGKGGGVGVIPGGEEMNREAYGNKAAQEVLPADFKEVSKSQGADWDWEKANYPHPLMHPFQEWRQARPKLDFVEQPRGAWQYWNVQPRQGEVNVLVTYADGSGRPALVERVVDLKRGRPGRVLQFTTPPGWKAWNNYVPDPNENSYYLVLARQAIGHLTGDADRQALNFLSGQGVPRVPVPVGGQVVPYHLYRDGPAPPAARVASVTVEEGKNEVRLPQANEPGNYTLRPVDADGEPMAWFSVNLPPEESNLARVPREEIEAVLGPEAVLTPETNIDIDPRGLTRPWEMMPLLMVLLLVLLAVENLLANKFYRREA